MEQVFAKIKEKDYHAAFVQLWLRANQTVKTGTIDCQQASLWSQNKPATSSAIDLAAWLENPEHTSWASVSAYPLELLGALDGYLADELRHSHALIEVEAEQQKYALVRRRFPSCPARSQAPNPRHWAPKHDVFPLSLSISTDRMSLLVSKPETMLKTLPEEVRCRLTHFNDDGALQVDEDATRGCFIATGITNVVERGERLTAECRQSKTDEVHFWVAPELTAPRTLQSAITKELATTPQENLLLAVPGSFHWEDEQGFWNGSDVIDGNGAPLFTHRKMTQFSYPDEQGNTLSEGIITARQMYVADTPLGLVCVVICKDFSDAGAQIIKTAIAGIAPDWLLVASYGDKKKTLARHSQTACELETQCGTRSLIANQEPHIQIGTGSSHDAPAPGFAHADKTTLLVESGGTTITIRITAAKPSRPRLQRIK